MLTQEQIQHLKPGDKLALSHPLIFREYDSENDELLAINNGEYIYFHAVDVELPSEHGTSVPTTKHDPTRLFKKGDKVRIVKYNGRKFDGAPPTFQLGKVYRVDEDEDTKHCYVMLQSCDLYYAHPVAFLELVTPVVETEPYIMLENVPRNSIEVRDKRTNKVEATFYFGKDHAYTFEQAATRAEAERDSLNAEHRKEQNND